MNINVFHYVLYNASKHTCRHHIIAVIPSFNYLNRSNGVKGHRD